MCMHCLLASFQTGNVGMQHTIQIVKTVNDSNIAIVAVLCSVHSMHY